MSEGATGGSNPQGTYIFSRANFIQYAVWEEMRCSNDFPWYTRTTLMKTSPPGSLSFDFYFRPAHQYDNSCGPGFTNIGTD